MNYYQLFVLTAEMGESLLESIKGDLVIIMSVALALLVLLYGVLLILPIIRLFLNGGQITSIYWGGYTYWEDGVEYDQDGDMLGEWEDYYNEDGSKKYDRYY